MEKALAKVGSIKTKAGSFWITKKAKEEIKDISQDLTMLSNTVEQKAKWVFDKLKGKPPKSLAELLKEYSLPPGLFPQNVTCYEVEETKARLIVHLPYPCEVTFKDSSVIRYSTRVRAILLRGKLVGIEGMKTRTLVWVKLTSVAVEGDKLSFTAGVKKSRPRDGYDVPRDAIRVDHL